MSVEILSMKETEKIGMETIVEAISQVFRVTVRINETENPYIGFMMTRPNVFLIKILERNVKLQLIGENEYNLYNTTEESSLAEFLFALSKTKEFNDFKKEAMKLNEELKEKYYPKVLDVMDIKEVNGNLQIDFDLENEEERLDISTLYIWRNSESVRTNLDNQKKKMKQYCGYLGWEDDIKRQVLNHKKVKLKMLFEDEYVKKYLK
ncbi:hypothetical protein [Bacillus luti]|uniref:hypothetical protein n=1 Tax=Bacillus luti TaxID=2026191 RepID=UPI0012E9896E|nr:hypothetical protein [Bacillus luti]